MDSNSISLEDIVALTGRPKREEENKKTLYIYIYIKGEKTSSLKLL